MQVMLGTMTGVAIVLLGVALFPLPIPLGLVFIALGFVIILTVNPAVAAFVRARRARSPKFDLWVGKVERVLPERTRRLIRKDEPDADAA